MHATGISLGGISFQPLELVKLCFLYVGASTMDRIVTKRNLFLFIVYSAAICGCLALMNDFGTALIFFVAFLVIAFLRSAASPRSRWPARPRALQAFWPFASGRISCAALQHGAMRGNMPLQAATSRRVR